MPKNYKKDRTKKDTNIEKSCQDSNKDNDSKKEDYCEPPTDSPYDFNDENQRIKNVKEWVLSQCGPCRDPLTIIAASNTWGPILKYKDINLSSLCKLRDVLTVLYPWDNYYDTERMLYNKKINQYPSVIVKAEKTSHIKKAMRWAQKHNMPFSIRSGGHSFEGYSVCEGMVIDLKHMNSLKISEDKKTVIVEAGALIGPTVLELQKCGNYIIPTGTCPNVGLAGLTLGGGIGFYDRRWGLTCDNLLEAEMILADGKTIWITKDNEYSDLLWACRGAGGGNFGIVTKMKFKLRTLKTVVLFDIKFEWKYAFEVIKAWQDFAPYADNLLSMECSLKGPDRGIILFGQWGGKKSDLNKVLKPLLLKLECEPFHMEVNELSVLDAARKNADNNIRPPFQKVKSSIIYEPISNKGIETLINWASKISKESITDGINISALSGEISKIKTKDTAFLHRRAIAWIEYACYWKDQRHEEEKLEWIRGAFDQVRPYVSPFCYVNFPDLDLENWKWAFWGWHYEKLQKIKRKYDPNDYFHMPQGIRLE